MDLLDNDDASLIKDGSLLPIGMDINMLLTLLAKFRGVEEEVT
jgi:aryl carrier-like protein